MFIYPNNSVILAPLSGYSDIPFRLSARRHGCKYAFTEMIDAGSIVYSRTRNFRFLERLPEEKWLGAQLIGADISNLEKSTIVINEYNFDVLDFNLGCPVKKVVRKGQGAALSKDISAAAKALEVIVKNSRIPVTVKTRILDVFDPAPTVALAKSLENAGASALTLHGRTQTQFYSGTVYHEIISSVKAELKIQVIANGGVVTYKSCENLKDRTGCSVVMVARGAMGNPWIFEELLDPEGFKAPTLEEFTNEIELHVADILRYYGEERGLRISRKIVLDYIKGRGYGGHLKSAAAAIKKYEDFKNLLLELVKGPAERYKIWLASNPDAPRRLTL